MSSGLTFLGQSRRAGEPQQSDGKQKGVDVEDFMDVYFHVSGHFTLDFAPDDAVVHRGRRGEPTFPSRL
ncbi:hypothetical protein HMPREF9135_0181 [Segatella baroniae F0067]|uniref:Uncharacterized protein n=1 Tax=Segatella baroniae F0067 TaxID=1115809 RepID=U2P8S4_9BACT|nr:hypothetical protein HMPREF9135_0181 [Segatella baroniae F0067]